MLKNVIFLNDLPSNILNGAILILKEDFDIGKNIIKEDVQNVKFKSAIDEAQYIIEECMYKIEQQSINKKGFFYKILNKVKGCGNK